MAGIGDAHMHRDRDDVLVTVEDLVVEFPLSRTERVHAVSNLSFDILDGETLGLVGESGCGKSTTGRSLLRLPQPTSGKVVFDGIELGKLNKKALRRVRPRMQIIFQDPISSLNEHRKVKHIVAEGLSIWRTPRAEREAKVEKVMDTVGLDPEIVGDRKPGSFSGGQCQRICIARAIALEPKLLICDEPVSALDVSVQAQILNVLEDMKDEYGLTLLFISHDLAVVKNLCDRVIVMYLGRICEVAQTSDLFTRPAHPYTALLLESVPRMDRTMEAGVEVEERGSGELPSAINPPSGCRFSTRCPFVQDICREQVPEVREVAAGQFVACHFPLTGESYPCVGSDATTESASDPEPSVA
jgi:peptide/nickel transport system ATP-binding protein